MKDILKIIAESSVLVAVISSLTTYLITRINNRDAKKAGASLVKTIDHANLLYPLLWEVLNQFDARRICIFEFHNGGKFYSGKSIQRVTMSYEVASYGVRRLSPEFQGTVMSDAFHIGVKELLETSLVYYQDVDSLPEMGTKSLLRYYKSKAIAGFLYKSKQGDPTACLTVCFGTSKPLNMAELDLMKVRASDIEKLFMS